MYLPEGKVMPAYSTWQPIEGKIQPVASADNSTTRRLVDPRGDLLRGKPIVSTLLGVFGGPSDHSLREAKPPSGVHSWSRPPDKFTRVRPSRELALVRDRGKDFALPHTGRA
jgi:hypothetical protein